MLLDIKALDCCYPNQTVIHQLSLALAQGDLAALIGPSGCGKTTLLRAIAGFVNACSGSIQLNGTIISAPHVHLAPEKRQIGMVFQDYALFPHLTVEQNIAFGLRTSTSQRNSKARVAELLSLTDLTLLAKRYPHELSGGQQQRVALARALAPEPALILLDEPFSNLDVELREKLCPEVRNILKQTGASAIMVTHDQQEAFNFAEYVGVLHQGHLLQWDSPYNIYHKPCSLTVANFIGHARTVQGEIVNPFSIQTALGTFQQPKALTFQTGTRMRLLLRPDDVIPATSLNQGIKARLLHKAFKGNQTLYTLSVDEELELISYFPSHYDHSVGEEVYIEIKPTHLIMFPS